VESPGMKTRDMAMITINAYLGNKMTGPINISIQLAPSVRNILPREEKHQLTCAPHQE
jgi:hypothetical protein